MSDFLTLDECAARLGTSRHFVDTMVKKNRLHPNQNGKVPVTEFEQFATLLNKLRGGGIAAMVDAVDKDL